MSTRLSVFALSAILIASMGISPIFGQIVEPIVVTTDKASYGSGDTVMVTGEVKELLSGFPVTLQLIAANGNLVTVQQLEVGSDRMFSTEIAGWWSIVERLKEHTQSRFYMEQSLELLKPHLTLADLEVQLLHTIYRTNPDG